MNTNTLRTLVTAVQRRLATLPQRLQPSTTESDRLPKNLMLTGARGCGKSTLLLHYSQGRRLLYFSADNSKITGEPLYDLVSSVLMLGYKGAIIDKIYCASNWSVHLKVSYDDYPGKIAWTSDSLPLVLHNGKADLSRRCVAIQMSLMSFRESLCLEASQIYSKYKPGDTTLPTQPDAELLNHFFNYRSYDTRPSYQEKDSEACHMVVIDKILNNNIPFFLPSISENNLRVMRAIIDALVNSSIPRVQVTSLYSDWGIGTERLHQLLPVMESVDPLKIVRHLDDTKTCSIGAKMLFADPRAYEVLNANRETECETYTAHCFSKTGHGTNAMKDEKKGDYVITKDHAPQTPEVGRENKNPKGADCVLRDNTDHPVDNAIPFRLVDMVQQPFVIQRRREVWYHVSGNKKSV